jgi:hypothetical protein
MTVQYVLLYCGQLYILLYTLPADDGVLPKHVAVNKRCIIVYANCAYVGFKKLKLSLILMDPCIVDYSVEIPTRCSFIIEFTMPSFF